MSDDHLHGGPTLTADQDLLAEPTVDLSVEDPAERERLDRIQAEITAGFVALDGLGPAVSVFGSARTSPDDPAYELTRSVARRLGEAGFSIITGGGPGMMEAANRGARDVGATSVGLNIELPHEQHPNEHLDVSLDFRYFFARRLMFVRYACAFVNVPGGFGTLDEMFEALTLIQTEKIDRFPVVLVGSDFWAGLLGWMDDQLLGRGMIDPADLEDLHVTDDPDGVVDAITSVVGRPPTG